MVAVVIIMVGMLGLLQAINVAMEHNLKNHMRDEAVYMGEKYMNELKGRGFDNISATYALVSVPSRIRGGRGSLTVERSSTVLPPGAATPTTKQLTVVVKWKYKGAEYENRVMSPVSIVR
jgi:type IV pilus assembly protein PilV